MIQSGLLIIDETGLDALRAGPLSPETILPQLERGPVLVRVPPGVGKSHLIDELLAHPQTFQQYDLVICVAPTWGVLNERRCLRNAENLPGGVLALEPRPKKRCGPLDAEWTAHERLGRISYAKQHLCGSCRRRSKCKWPLSLKDKLKNICVLLCTEQHLINEATFLLRVIAAAKKTRVLLILDEARLTHASFDITITKNQLRQFSEAIQLALPRCNMKVETADAWTNGIKALTAAGKNRLAAAEWNFPVELNFFAHDIQQAGLAQFGQDFRYIGYLLTSFAYSRPEERWWTAEASVKFISRPYLKTRLLVLSAHLREEYIRTRLGLPELIAPFNHLRVRHSGTRVYNFKNRSGAACYFQKNKGRILDFFARKILLNVRSGLSTLLVCRKKDKEACAQYLRSRLKGWGCDVHFVTSPGQYRRLGPTSSKIIPIIHYGAVGVNSFSAYQCCYCLNSFNISETHLNSALQSTLADEFRIRTTIKMDVRGNRRVVVPPGHKYSGLDRLGDTYLHMLEADPVLQTVARCRFYTQPREVILFQMYDFSQELGAVQEFRSLEDGSALFNLPDLRVLDCMNDIVQLRDLIGRGKSLREAARLLGIDKSTASRLLRRAARVSHTDSLIINRKTETPGPHEKPEKTP